MSDAPAKWIVSAEVVLAIHEHQLVEHGGAGGVRDPAAIEAALARPANLAAYGAPDAADLAAAHAFGLARNHGFVDGNKRTAWVVARVFLEDNGHQLHFDVTGAIRIMEGTAAGSVAESELAAWFRQRLTRGDPDKPDQEPW